METYTDEFTMPDGQKFSYRTRCVLKLSDLSYDEFLEKWRTWKEIHIYLPPEQSGFIIQQTGNKKIIIHAPKKNT